MSRLAAALGSLALFGGLAGCGSDGGSPASAPEGSQVAGAGPGSSRLLSGVQPLLNGEPQDLADFEGKVVMVVNTASECGFTPQFEGLESLYRERRSEGFVILGFPADDVAGQEPRSDRELARFCEQNFRVSFPVFAKSNLVTDPVNPLFDRLAATAGAPSWNFNKYLVDRDGNVVERFDAATAPDDPVLGTRIDELLES
jgi:glutathione peroxidase